MLEQLIVDFVAISEKNGMVHHLDKLYVQNALLALLHSAGLAETVLPSQPLPQLLTVLDQLIDYAVAEQIIDDSNAARDVLAAQIMDLVTPLPSVVNQQFWQAYIVSPQHATDYFYQLSRANNYIKTREIAKNKHYTYLSPYGELEITINLSKPEKNSKDIAKELNKQLVGYPVGLLAIENEGYLGHEQHPGRKNHRLVRMELTGEPWAMQYSPYAYYSEHCIFLSEAVRPMSINRMAVRRLLEIVARLPHYFVGSNAGLPIVGGSILSHDHYQGGRHVFPMEQAAVDQTVVFHGFEHVTAQTLHWPMSVIRLTADDATSLENLACHILEKWQHYSDASVDVLSHTGETKHNTINPIARRVGQQFQLDIVLRNNRTTEQHPNGLFHPHRDVQHIKKENIGLIEVMGLAILPPRLKAELHAVAQYVLGDAVDVAEIHRDWAVQLRQDYGAQATAETIGQIIDEAVGQKFTRVLEDAGVFKRDEVGRAAFAQFLRYCNE